MPESLEVKLMALLERGVAEGVYSGGQGGVWRYGESPMVLSVGETAWRSSVPAGHTIAAIDADTRFDLASLTKAVVTASLVWHGVSSGVFSLDSPVKRWLSEWVGREGVTVRHLLTHTSGLVAWEPLYKEGSRSNLLERVMRTSPLRAPGTKAEYSDLGYILLGMLLERSLDGRLDELTERLVTGPLGMTRTCFVRHGEGERLEGYVAATEETMVKGKCQSGEVHDENAWVMGGVAGHAGLFGTAADMLRWGCAILNQGYAGGDSHWGVSASSLRSMLSSSGGVAGKEGLLGTYLGGLDTPSGERSTAGRFASRRPPGVTVGHLGFTGTSIWIDRSRRVVGVLLTNRVHPCRDQRGIREVREAFHGATMQGVEKRWLQDVSEGALLRW